MFFHFGTVDVDPRQQFHLTVKLQFFEKFALTTPQVDHLKGNTTGLENNRSLSMRLPHPNNAMPTEIRV